MKYSSFQYYSFLFCFILLILILIDSLNFNNFILIYSLNFNCIHQKHPYYLCLSFTSITLLFSNLLLHNIYSQIHLPCENFICSYSSFIYFYCYLYFCYPYFILLFFEALVILLTSLLIHKGRMVVKLFSFLSCFMLILLVIWFFNINFFVYFKMIKFF